MIDVRTPIEKARDERNKRICNSFLENLKSIDPLL